MRSKIILTDPRIIPLQRQNDQYIMEVASNSGWFTLEELSCLNACRLYYGVLLVSDICDIDGKLVPNLELGHVYLPGHEKDAEFHAAERIRDEQNLNWEQWGGRLNEYFNFIEGLFSPELMIIGGGVSKKHKKFLHHIDVIACIYWLCFQRDISRHY